MRNNNCYICLEPCRSYDPDHMYLVDYKHLYFDCKCTVYTHKRCMQIWLNRNPCCIICRGNARIYQNKILNLISVRGIVWILFIWYIYMAVLDDFYARECRDISIY